MAKTTLELPTALRDRIAAHKGHPRQAYHEVIARALDALEAQGRDGTDGVLEKHRAFLRNTATKHGLEARVVGSRATGDARPGDDLDLVVRLDEGRSLFDLAAFLSEVEARLPVAVDLRMHTAIPTGTRGALMRGAVAL